MSSWRASKLTVGTLRVVNYRGLANLELTDITPLTVLLGDNGSGKSSLLDVFSFIADCFGLGLRAGWQERGGARHMKTKGSVGPVVIEVGLRERIGSGSMTYRLTIDERDRRGVVVDEQLRVHGPRCRPIEVLRSRCGKCTAVPTNSSDRPGRARQVTLRSEEALGAAVLGQLGEYPSIAALHEFVSGWHRYEMPLKASPWPPHALASRPEGSLELVDLPERSLHPRLHAPLAEAMREDSERHQLFVTTHSPLLANPLRPTEVVSLARDANGHTRAVRASDVARVMRGYGSGNTLGHMWIQGQIHEWSSSSAAREPRTSGELQ